MQPKMDGGVARPESSKGVPPAEAAGGLATALAGRRPQSRDEVLARLRSARDQLAAALKPVDPAPRRPARPPLLRRRANRPPLQAP
jgi:hypothetical protein